MFSSSLPSFPNGFHGTATTLKTLRLQSREDDGAFKLAESESVTGTEREEFQCPQLRIITVDGRNYYEVCRRDARWTDTIAGVINLTIARFKPQLGESCTIRELFQPLSNVVGPEVLCICDLVLPPSPAVLQPLQPMSGVNILHFFDCHDHQVMREIFRVVGAPYDLSFVRCSLGGSFGGIGSFGHLGRLELKEISHELVSALCFWNGSYLDLVNCPRVDDVFLGAMAFEENGVLICAPYVRGLSIHDCPNFSVAALRRLVKSKLHLPPVPNWELISTRFERIAVSGDVPPFSPEDVAWFWGNVTHFYCPEFFVV
jgi:hypothetical protein